MTIVTETAHVPLEPELLWHRVGSFCSVGHWHPMLAKVIGGGEQPGALRCIQTWDGEIQVERLEAVDSVRHCYRYSMEETALPVANYSAEFCIDEAGAGASTVTWSACFDVIPGYEKQGVTQVRDFIRAGLSRLSHGFEEYPSRPRGMVA